MSKLRLALLLGATSVVACASVFASPMNVIVDGGFENQNLPAGSGICLNQCFSTAWTVSGVDDGNTFDALDDGSPTFKAHSGKYFASFGSEFPTSIEQTVSDIAGASEILSFWISADGHGLGSFSAMVNGNTLYQFNIGNRGLGVSYLPYQKVDVYFTASQTGTDYITFTGSDPNGFINIDDVTLIDPPSGPAAVTPEPSSLILLGTGVLAAAGAQRRRVQR